MIHVHIKVCRLLDIIWI